MDTHGKFFTRSELYDLVWSKPIQKLAVEFGLSDVGLSKACKKADIPVPERGYWAKKAAGKSTIRVALPPRFPGASDQVDVGLGNFRPRYWYDDEYLLTATLPAEPVFDEPLEAVEARVRKIVGRTPCPQNFDRADPYISRILAHDEERRAEYARCPTPYNAPKYDSGPERRRLLILNALFFAWRRIGCTPSISTSKWSCDDPSSRRACVSVGSMHVSVPLEPVAARKAQRVGRTSGDRMRLSFGTAYLAEESAPSWEDSNDRRLEACL